MFVEKGKKKEEKEEGGGSVFVSLLISAGPIKPHWETFPSITRIGEKPVGSSPSLPTRSDDMYTRRVRVTFNNEYTRGQTCTIRFSTAVPLVLYFPGRGYKYIRIYYRCVKHGDY